MPSSESPALTGRTGAAIERLTLRQPDDWHVHLRDDAMLASVVNYTARQFARAIVMPNLKPPVTTVAEFAAAVEQESAAEGVVLQIRTPRGNSVVLLKKS